MSNLASIVDINFNVNTNEYYEQIFDLSHEHGCFWDPKLFAWVITSNSRCQKVIKEKWLTRNRLNLPQPKGYEDLSELVTSIFDSQFMFGDSQEHHSRKTFFSKVLTKIASQDSFLNETIYGHITSLVSDIQEKEIDVYAHFLQPVVSLFICSVLGINTSDATKMFPYINQYVRFLDGKIKNEKELITSYYSIVKLYSTIQPYASRFYDKQADHADISNYLLVLAAGHESIAYALSTILLTENDLNSDDKVLTDDAFKNLIDEALRYDSPVQMMGRLASVDILIDEHHIHSGEKVFLHIGAANRDKITFTSPDIFNARRSQQNTLAFGIGNSHCIGSQLAKKATLVILKQIRKMKIRIVIDDKSIIPSQSVSGRGFIQLPGIISFPGLDTNV